MTYKILTMTKKNITIKREIRKKLHEYSSYDENLDETVNRLINEAGDISNEFPPQTGSTGIKLTEETIAKIVSLKHDPQDSYSSVFERLFQKIEK